MLEHSLYYTEADIHQVAKGCCQQLQSAALDPTEQAAEVQGFYMLVKMPPGADSVSADVTVIVWARSAL